MYGNGWPGPDAERRQHREDLALEERGRARAQLVLAAVVDAADRDPLRGERRARAPSSRGATGRAVSSSTRSRIAASASRGVSPSCERTGRPDAAWSISPATRTMKNSSRFDEKIEQNLTRSSSGIDSSAASSSTRALKSSHESSRFRSVAGAATGRFGHQPHPSVTVRGSGGLTSGNDLATPPADGSRPPAAYSAIVAPVHQIMTQSETAAS